MVGWGRAEGLPDDSGGGGRSGWEGGHLWASGFPGLNSGTGADTGVRSGGAELAGTSGDEGDSGDEGGLDLGSLALPGPNGETVALPGLNLGTGALRGLNSGTGALPGLNWGSGALSPLLWHSPRAILSSPSAAVQGAELLSVLTPSVAFSLKAGVVAGSRTLTDVISSSGSAAIRGSVAPCGDGLSVAADSGSPSAVGSGMRSSQRGDGGLGTGSGVELARFSWEQAGNGDPFLASVHSTKVGEIRSRTILGRRCSAHEVQAGVLECTEPVVRVGGEAGEDQEQSGVTLEQCYFGCKDWLIFDSVIQTNTISWQFVTICWIGG